MNAARIIDQITHNSQAEIRFLRKAWDFINNIHFYSQLIPPYSTARIPFPEFFSCFTLKIYFCKFFTIYSTLCLANYIFSNKPSESHPRTSVVNEFPSDSSTDPFLTLSRMTTVPQVEASWKTLIWLDLLPTSSSSTPWEAEKVGLVGVGHGRWVLWGRGIVSFFSYLSNCLTGCI